MKVRKDRMIEFTTAELVVLEWRAALMRHEGLSDIQAYDKISASVPCPGATYSLLSHGEFQRYLLGYSPYHTPERRQWVPADSEHLAETQ